jgi:hypothetical protein
MRTLFVQAAAGPDTTILLGPKVVLDFSGAADAESTIEIGRCVTIRSFVPSYRVPVGPVAEAPEPAAATELAPPRRRTGAAANVRVRAEFMASANVDGLTMAPPEVPVTPATPVSGRSSTTPGPLLKFGPHRAVGNRNFLRVACSPSDPEPHDHVRIEGFRLLGPSLGYQEHSDTGILISGCVDVEVSNMEIAGWGAVGVRVQDGANEDYTPPLLAEPWQLRKLPGACREPPYNGPNGRIGTPSAVRIFDNFIHHNQHPRTLLEGGAAGYGVAVYQGAWARIYQNLFSDNRHAIAGSGNMGGYEATQNLVLGYGGIHYDGLITAHTHAFDIHGTGDNGFDGFAGSRTLYSYNAFQYRDGAAISLRGSPRCGVEISHNVFPHPGLENDWGDDAVKLRYRQDLDVVRLGPSNTLEHNSFGHYGVCDFDGDGTDDLFLPTGVSWWFSGRGESPWRFLAQRNERLEQVRLGYFDGDDKCDVVSEQNGAWMISSGGTETPYRLGTQYAPLSEVHFGRFDPSQRDARLGVTRRTTHAFWRTSSGRWKIALLAGADQSWRDAAKSSFPMKALRFGDFTGDGVTDVLAVSDGRWAISDGATSSWRKLNPSLGSDVRKLHFADLDSNNVDDILRVVNESQALGQDSVRETVTWYVSYDGVGPWQLLKSYTWTVGGRPPLPLPPAFAGRFGPAAGGAVLTVDRSGSGRFYGLAEGRAGAEPEWRSQFNY